MSAPPRRGRWVLLALAALFFSGLIASFILVESGWRPSATRNYGELVEPARPIEDVALIDLDGRETRFSALHGKWMLLYFGSAECLKPCTDNLYKMRQIAAAQGTEERRVRRVFVVTDSAALDMLRYTLRDYPGMRVLRGSPDAVRELSTQFALPEATPQQGRDRVYVVDPLGNFVMSYPADADPRRMNKDLKLLLRASHIG